MTVSSAVTVFLVTLASVWLLLTWILRSLRPRDTPGRTRLCCVLGSGGHTTEMVRLVTSLPPETFSPRTYVMAETDRFSEAKVEELEMERPGQHVIVRVPRAREVGQSYVSSVYTSLKALMFCLLPVVTHQPQLLLVNGPGTCLPVALVTWLLHVSRLSTCQIIFVESLCRVKTLSLTGKILQHFATESLVLWPELAEKHPKTKYIGKFL